MADLEPIMFEEAITKTIWKIAMEEELKIIEKNEMWEMVDFPQHKTAIDVKWVFKVKVKPDGSQNTRHSWCKRIHVEEGPRLL